MAVKWLCGFYKRKLIIGKAFKNRYVVFFHSGHLYTGTDDGKIVHIYDGELRILAAPSGTCI